MKPILIALFLATGLVQGADDWPAYGRDAAGTRFSPVKEIHKDNIASLKVSWTKHTHALDPTSDLNGKAAFEATPILFEGSLYLSTPFDQVIALDPATGVERWKYDPDVDRRSNYSEVSSRGVSAWANQKAAAGAPCRARIFVGTIDARLIALDARTGKPCQDFGANGAIDLTRDVNLRDRGDYQ